MPDNLGPYSRYALDLAPPWLRAERGAKWLEAHGETLDALVERLVDATAAHLVDAAPDDAIPSLGRERAIARIPGEADWAYRERVRAAWSIWQWGGTKRAVEEVFRLLGYEQVVVTELWTRDRLRWAEFEVLLVAGPPLGNLSREQVIALVNDVKAAHSRLVRITHVVGGFFWDNGTLWDSYPQDPDAWWDGDVVWVA